MGAVTSLSCLDCPALKTIERELKNVQSVRKFALKNSVDAMEQSEQLSRADYVQEILTATKETCTNIFTLLDDSEALLMQSQKALEEACTPGKPYVTSEPALLGRQVLHCSSEVAADLAPSISTAILPEN